MANILNGFLDNVLAGATNPGGNLKDYQHAARLFNDDGFRLAPKSKFLFYTVFELSPSALKVMPQLDQRHKQEINMLVKAIDLPKFQITTVTKNMYNRKKNLQTAIEYDPINITFHDDNLGLTSTLMEAYFRYYYRDGNYRTEGTAPPYAPRNTYGTPASQNYRYGLDNDHTEPFFKKITIYQMARHEYIAYTLVNPLVTGLTHDQMDASAGGEVTQNQLTVAYETVFYSRGPVGADNPAGFGTAHYDTTPSPLSIRGGGTISLLGQGGVVGGISDILTDIAGGQFNLGTALNVFNTYKNAKSLTKEGLRQEGMNILKSSLGNITKEAVGGISDVNFPKQTGNGGASSAVPTTGGTVNTNATNYGTKVTQAATANDTSPPPWRPSRSTLLRTSTTTTTTTSTTTTTTTGGGSVTRTRPPGKPLQQQIAESRARRASKAYTVG